MTAISIDQVHLSVTAFIFLCGAIAGMSVMGLIIAACDWVSYLRNPLHRWR